MSDDAENPAASTHADVVLAVWLLSQRLGITIEDAASVYLKVSSALVAAVSARGKAN